MKKVSDYCYESLVFWRWGVFNFTWFEAQLNHASQTEPPCQSKLLKLNMECSCDSFSSSLTPPTSLSVSLRLATIASSACFWGNIVSISSDEGSETHESTLIRQKTRINHYPRKRKPKKKSTTPDPDNWKFLQPFHKKTTWIPPHKKRD